VLAHELGHFKRKHVIKDVGCDVDNEFNRFGVLGWVIDQDWFYTGLGIAR